MCPEIVFSCSRRPFELKKRELVCASGWVRRNLVRDVLFCLGEVFRKAGRRGSLEGAPCTASLVRISINMTRQLVIRRNFVFANEAGFSHIFDAEF